MLDWDTLRIILAVSRKGTILGAARELDVNVATVSRHVSRAEEALNAKLFDRRHKGLSPTRHGQEAIETAKLIEVNVLSLQRQIFGAKEEVEGTIRLSIPLAFMDLSFSNDLRKFQSLYPSVSFNINETDNEANFADLETDVAIRVGENPPNSLWGFKIGTLGFSFFASKCFIKEWGPKIENDPDTTEIPYLALSMANPDSDRGEFLARFPKAKLHGSCTKIGSLVPLLRQGVGAGRIARFMARPHDDLVKIFDCDERWNRSLWILTHKDFRDTKRIRLFMEFIQDEFCSNERSY